MAKFIFGNNKYELGGINNDVIGLPVSFENLPEEIKIQGQTLYLPSPFHISLVYIDKIMEKYNITIPDFLSKVVYDFCDFTSTNEIAITGYNEFRFVDKKREKKTVVVMCEVSNLNEFFDLMNQKYNLNIKYPTPHVTLYNTLKGEHGMSLMDSDDIKNFTILIENPIGRIL